MGVAGRALLGLISGLLLSSTAFAQNSSDDASEEGQANVAAGASAGVRTDAAEPGDDSGGEEEDSSESACGAGSMAVTSGGCGKRWRLIGYAEYSQLVVRDEDPENDYQTTAWLQGSWRLLRKHNVQAWTRVGFRQLYSVDEGERGARFNDVRLGADYLHSVPLQGWEGRAVSFQHRLFADLPTSREAQREDMRASLTVLERVRINPLPFLFTGVDLIGGYRFHKYAERAGLEGGPLPRANFDGRVVVEAFPFQSATFGSILLGASGGIGYTRNYEGRDPDPTVSGESAEWSQRYNWQGYLYYLPKPYLWAGVSIGHGPQVLRDGVRQTDFVNRDVTQMAFSMIGIY